MNGGTAAGADIAVVVTCHNYARTLHRCLDSIRAQSLAPARVVVVDDASDDAPHTVAARFEGVLPDLVFRRVNYRNANRARNTGFSETESPFLVFFDADNEMGPFFLERLHRALVHDADAAFAYCDRVNMVEGPADRLPEPPGHWRSRAFDPAALRRANFVDMASMIRRDAFPGFDESMPMYQDWDLWLSIVSSGGRGVHVPEPLFTYRVHGASLGHRTDPEPALWQIRRKHRLGTFGSIPVLRDSLTLFRGLRRFRRLLRRMERENA